MPRIIFLLLGLYLLLLSVGFLAGYAPLVREKFRSRADLKPYMRRCGAVYAVIGAAGLLFYFCQEAIMASRVLAAALGIVCFGALVSLVIFNHAFMKKSGR